MTEDTTVHVTNGNRLCVDLPMPVADLPPHVLKAIKLGMLLMARVVEKEQTYGSSWKRRGGAGAFMVTARKWDRIEETAKRNGWDVFAAMNVNDASILDDVGDLIGYLLLWLGDNEVRNCELGQSGPMEETLRRMAEETRQRKRLELTEEEQRRAQTARPPHIPIYEPPVPPHVYESLRKPDGDTVHPVTTRDLRSTRADSSEGMPFDPMPHHSV